jgi:rSAM/selenodomain-associated transferase 1
MAGLVPGPVGVAVRAGTAVVVFAKPPRVGEAKTRLAATLGAVTASRLARAFLEDTWRMVSAWPSVTPVLATTDATAAEWPAALRPSLWLQGPGDLGARLERVLRRALRRHARAIAIGADTPGLPPSLVESAQHALDRSEAVLGPALDGGFYLIGLRRCPRGLLRGLPWSAADTFARTIERLRASGLDVAVLPPWFDVDEPRDLRRLRRWLDRGRANAPATRRVLATCADDWWRRRDA